MPRDFQITVAPQPMTVVKGDQFEMTFDVAVHRVRAR